MCSIPVEMFDTPHWHSALNCCENCPKLSIPDDETENDITVPNIKFHKRKELVLFDESVSSFHQLYYKPAIEKLAYHLPHMQIVGTKHIGSARRDAMLRCNEKKDIKVWCDFADRFVAEFATEIQSKHFRGNQILSVEDLTLAYTEAMIKVQLQQLLTQKSAFSMKRGVVIDHAVGAPGHGKDMVDGLKAVDKRYLRTAMIRNYIAEEDNNMKTMTCHSVTQMGSASLAAERKHLLQQHADHVSNILTSKSSKHKITG
eukprot:6209078-Ditylum_brightwellii.AAC.1